MKFLRVLNVIPEFSHGRVVYDIEVRRHFLAKKEVAHFYVAYNESTHARHLYSHAKLSDRENQKFWDLLLGE